MLSIQWRAIFICVLLLSYLKPDTVQAAVWPGSPSSLFF